MSSISEHIKNSGKPLTVNERIAKEYQAWLKQNPKAPKRKRVRAFDTIADEVQGR